MQRRLLLRSRMVQAIREVHHANGFVEIETPTLIKSTPEGARDFIVPSRLQPGTVYALPQSPQQLKQLLMVAGIDRYFQIARCYRDEDLRGDRQPEFTQLDLEMSFVDEAAVMGFVEAMAIEVSRVTVPERPILATPFPMLTYEEAIERFGSDKPDLRFGMELVDLGPVLAIAGRDAVIGLRGVRYGTGGRRPGQGDRGARDGRRHPARDRRADRARPTVRRQGSGASRRSSRAARSRDRSPSSCRTTRSGRSSSRSAAAEGDLILIVADTAETTADVLGRLRVELGDRLGLADPNVLSYVWINRFPMYQWDAENGRWHATHNPFSGVLPEDEALLVTASGDPARPSPERSRRVRPGRSSTTSRSTAGSWAAARSGSIGATCSSAASSSRATPSRRCTRSSGPSSTPSTTGRRRMAGSPSASTAGLRCSRSRPTSARSWPSPRPSRAPT